MHELYLVNSILNIINEYALKENFKKVNSIKISFCCLHNIDPTNFKFVFELQSINSLAENAKLKFKILPLTVYCLNCEIHLKVKSYLEICKKCLKNDFLIISRKEEIQILDIDVD